MNIFLWVLRGKLKKWVITAQKKQKKPPKKTRPLSINVINYQMLPALMTARHKVNKTGLNCCFMALQ